MTLDDLAAAVVGVEPDDLRELAQIHEALGRLCTTTSLPASAEELVAQGTRCAEQLIMGECENASRAVADLSAIVSALQRLCESADDEPSTASSMRTPETPKPGTSAPESTTTAAPPAGPPEALAADPALLGEFVTESREHLERAEATLLDLETNPDNPEGVNLIFRAFHTIKGTSGFLGLTSINTVAHKAETLLDRARKGEIRLAGTYADLALEATDVLKRLIDQVSAGMVDLPAEDALRVSALLERLDSPNGVSDTSVPPLRVGDILVARSVVDRTRIEEIARSTGPNEKLGEKLVQAGVADAKSVAAALRTQQQIAGPAQAADATLRVSMARLDKLIDMVGELVIAQAMVTQDAAIRDAESQSLSRKLSQSNKITRELQDLTLSMRMVPLKSTFQKMARLVRDVARKNGKEVRFIADGEDTEIDRSMVDAINDPLVHMMRNAVDHGLEPPDERAAAGKSEQGTVVLRAYHAAGKVVIEVQDDGRGIDPAKVLAKAVERGLVEPDRGLSASEIYDLLFLPGFSTAQTVTDVSGRGVGMDVVKKNIEALRGFVDVTSEKGRGSTFTIRLPLTLAIIDGMLLQVGSETYVLPTLNIEQAFRPTAESISTVAGRGEMVLLRGQLIPVFRLHRLFGVSGAVEDPTRALLVVIEQEGQRCALLADGLLGQQQVVIKSLGTALGDVQGVSGAAILGDGRVGLILDAGGILRIAIGNNTREAA